MSKSIDSGGYHGILTTDTNGDLVFRYMTSKDTHWQTLTLSNLEKDETIEVIKEVLGSLNDTAQKTRKKTNSNL